LVLSGFHAANYIAFNGDVMRELAAQYLALAEKQKATVPLMTGHRLMGVSLAFTGDPAEGRAHFDRAIALYNPAKPRPLITRFGQDVRVTTLFQRSTVLWFLGHPEAALADAGQALSGARDFGQAATLVNTLYWTSITPVLCGNHAAANALVDELIALADKKGALYWKAIGML